MSAHNCDKCKNLHIFCLCPGPRRTPVYQPEGPTRPDSYQKGRDGAPSASNDGLTLAAFQVEAERTIVGPWTERERRLGFGCGLTGEAGEVVDLVKKWELHGDPFDSAKLATEMGDVLWYLAALGSLYGVTLDQAARANINKRAKRHPNGFTQAGAQARADQG